MGIARFYRYLSERYPLINEALEGDAESFPEFDNLYLDLNGVIHNCSHGNDPTRSFLNNDEIFLAVFQYVNRLVHNIKPRKLLYLAIDGVAPRAKMNQQRSRRFRAAQANIALASSTTTTATTTAGSGGSGGSGFDSNQITPGTEFMEALSVHLEFFVAARLEEDPVWRGLEVVLSGPEVPGEGEHKIMDYIRTSKFRNHSTATTTVPTTTTTTATTATTTRHCLYGLDADLIMLGLSSHEAHFSLLREEVVFAQGGQKSGEAERVLVKKDKFQLLHLGVLREYLALEFLPSVGRTSGLRGDSSYGLSKEDLGKLDRVIDDFVLICFLIGNDFLPHLPLTEVSDGGLDRLFGVYKEVCLGLVEDDGIFSSLGQSNDQSDHVSRETVQEAKYLTKNTGEIEWGNFSDFLRKYGKVEEERLAEAIGKGEWQVGQKRVSSENFEDWYGKHGRKKGNKNISVEAAKKEYYRVKFSDNDKIKLYTEYLKGLQWNLFYYYRGVQDWGWFYPYFAAPFISDLVRDLDTLEGLEFQFDLGRPFSPYEQLMGVLPASSGRKFLPEVLSKLMTGTIKEFYPTMFEIDMDGVHVEWGGVVLLPFVDEKKLLAAMEVVKGGLTEAEKKRNSTGSSYIFSRAKAGKTGRIESSMPMYLPSIEGDIHVVKTEFAHFEIPSGRTFPNKTFDLVPDRKFPSMLRFPITAEVLTGFGVKVFGRESRNASLVVVIDPATDVEEIKVEVLADKLIDRKFQVDFPFVHPGVVRRVLTNTTGYVRDRGGKIEAYPRNRQEHDWDFNDLCSSLRFRGVAVEPRPDAVMVELTDGTMRLATTVREIVETSEAKKVNDAEELFVSDVNSPLFGCLVRKTPGKFRASCDKDGADFTDAALATSSKTDEWLNAGALAKLANVSPPVVQALLGSFPVRYRGDRADLGLQLFIQRGKGGGQSASLCCVGFSRFERNEWQFSRKALALLQEYFAAAPSLPRKLNDLFRKSGGGLPAAKDLFDGDVDKQVSGVIDFVKKKVKSMPHVPVGHEALDDSQVRLVEELLQQRTSDAESVEGEFTRKQLLTRDDLLRRYSVRAKFRDNFRSVKLGVRVRVYASGVPSGARGTVVAIYAFSDGAVQLEVLLDKKTLGAESLHGRTSNLRGIIVSIDNLILMSAPTAVKRPATAPVPVATPVAVVKPAVVVAPVVVVAPTVVVAPATISVGPAVKELSAPSPVTVSKARLKTRPQSQPQVQPQPAAATQPRTKPQPEASAPRPPPASELPLPSFAL